jgi:chromosome segregation ATPase
MAVRTATQTGVPESAALDMRLARDKLERAREALAEEDYERAKRLGEQASVDAQVAMAKSDSEAAREAAQELERSIQTLRDEVERGGEEVQ